MFIMALPIALSFTVSIRMLAKLVLSPGQPEVLVQPSFLQPQLLIIPGHVQGHPLIDLSVGNFLYVEYFTEINTASSSVNANVAVIHDGNAANNGDSSVTTTTFGVPEGALIALPIIPLLPKAVSYLSGLRRRKKYG